MRSLKFFCAWFGFICLCLLATPLWADDAPLLRLNTPMHTAMINRIDVDRAERWLVTASDDKTARVWDLATQRLDKVLRPPIGAGDEGKLYAVAISPDGALVATGGWTGAACTHNDCEIYLFDRANGALLRRIGGLPNVINHLAFSPDARRLAAALGVGGGMRVFDTVTGELLKQDSDYGDRSYWAEFDPAGRLLTSSYDGYVRLYDSDYRLLRKVKPAGGARPFAARFSPDGRRIAVGFEDSSALALLSAADLAPLPAPDTSGLDNGDISSIAWSADGTLYAGGKYDDGSGMNPILRWERGGQGRRSAWPGSRNTLMGLRSLADGGLLYGAQDPVWGRLDAQGRRVAEQRGDSADLRDMFEKFLLAADGRSVQFGLEPFGKRPARFELDALRYSTDPAQPTALTPPRTDGLALSDWKNTTTPKLNGQPLTLENYETSRRLAIAPDAQHFLLGTAWRLLYYDRKGQQIWQQPVPGAVQGVNIAANGQLAVAAYGDGTLRWHRLTDGAELLALFPHPDGQRWVLWTPQGYYAASPNGDELIGWHVGHGAERAADFYPVGQFRARYYRPDVIAQVLNTLDVERALAVAEQARGRGLPSPTPRVSELLPPLLTLLSPAPDTRLNNPEQTLRYRVRLPSGEPLTQLKVLVNGRPWQIQAPPAERGSEFESQFAVTLPAQDQELSLVAVNRYGASLPATVRLRWGGADQETYKPALYVLAVGVSAYAGAGVSALQYADDDARALVERLQRQKGKLYREVVVKRLLDGEASRDAVVEGLEWIKRETTQHDVAMVFLAGHGVNDNDGDYYFLPQDADTNHLRRSAVAYHDIKETVSRIAGKALFFVDTCHAGNVLGGQARGQADITRLLNDLSAAENGVVVFAAASGRQLSLELADWQHGAFTQALLEGLDGAADYGKDHGVDITELDAYLTSRVKTLTQGRQNPATAKPTIVPSFPLVALP